jgi:hypothetical protein
LLRTLELAKLQMFQSITLVLKKEKKSFFATEKTEEEQPAPEIDIETNEE